MKLKRDRLFCIASNVNTRNTLLLALALNLAAGCAAHREPKPGGGISASSSHFGARVCATAPPAACSARLDPGLPATLCRRRAAAGQDDTAAFRRNENCWISADSSALPAKPESAAQATRQASQAKLTAAREALRATPKVRRRYQLQLADCGDEPDTLEPTDLCHADVYWVTHSGREPTAIPGRRRDRRLAVDLVRGRAAYGLEARSTWIRLWESSRARKSWR